MAHEVERRWQGDPGAPGGRRARLLAFLAREDVPPVAQAAIGHAQFETIPTRSSTATALSVAA